MDTFSSMKKTNWYVATGAPCSGKYTIISELETRGYQVAHEAARAFMEAEIGSGNKFSRSKPI